MKRNRKAKIIATLGPTSSSKSIIEKLFNSGADVFRLNFSHGIIAEHRKNLENRGGLGGGKFNKVENKI